VAAAGCRSPRLGAKSRHAGDRKSPNILAFVTLLAAIRVGCSARETDRAGLLGAATQRGASRVRLARDAVGCVVDRLQRCVSDSPAACSFGRRYVPRESLTDDDGKKRPLRRRDPALVLVCSLDFAALHHHMTRQSDSLRADPKDFSRSRDAPLIRRRFIPRPSPKKSPFPAARRERAKDAITYACPKKARSAAPTDFISRANVRLGSGLAEPSAALPSRPPSTTVPTPSRRAPSGATAGSRRAGSAQTGTANRGPSRCPCCSTLSGFRERPPAQAPARP